MLESNVNYPNLLGFTPADRRPKLRGLRADTYLLDEATFDKRTTYVKVQMRKEDFNVDDFEEFDIRKNLFKQLFDKVKHKPPSFEEFCEITNIYEEATIKEEIKMINIPGMNEREVRALVDELSEICYNVSVKWEDVGFGAVKSILTLELPVEKARYLKLAGQPIVKQSTKSGWLEGIPAVKKVETYNQRVVKVTFIDDTFTKSVCSENDHFDIDVGITICLLKRFMGTNSDNATREYNKTMNYIHAVMEKNEKEKVAAQAQKSSVKAKKRKAELKRAAKKLKAKEEQIDIYKQAILRAQKETFSQFEDGGSI